jgi:hypothetical protein
MVGVGMGIFLQDVNDSVCLRQVPVDVTRFCGGHEEKRTSTEKHEAQLFSCLSWFASKQARHFPKTSPCCAQSLGSPTSQKRVNSTDGILRTQGRTNWRYVNADFERGPICLNVY